MEAAHELVKRVDAIAADTGCFKSECVTTRKIWICSPTCLVAGGTSYGKPGGGE